MKRLWVTILGVVVLIAGIAMLVLPGPGLVTILAGLAILAKEYTWARRASEVLRRRVRQAYDATRDRVQTARAARVVAREGTEDPRRRRGIGGRADSSAQE